MASCMGEVCLTAHSGSVYKIRVTSIDSALSLFDTNGGMSAVRCMICSSRHQHTGGPALLL